jgi:hypothetical protein
MVFLKLSPVSLGCPDVSALRTLITTAKQQDHSISDEAVIHAIPWTKIESEFVDAFPDVVTVAKIAQPQPGNAGPDASTCRLIGYTPEPLTERMASSTSDIFPEVPLSRFHCQNGIYKLRNIKGRNRRSNLVDAKVDGHRIPQAGESRVERQ